MNCFRVRVKTFSFAPTPFGALRNLWSTVRTGTVRSRFPSWKKRSARLPSRQEDFLLRQLPEFSAPESESVAPFPVASGVAGAVCSDAGAGADDSALFSAAGAECSGGVWGAADVSSGVVGEAAGGAVSGGPVCRFRPPRPNSPSHFPRTTFHRFSLQSRACRTSYLPDGWSFRFRTY